MASTKGQAAAMAIILAIALPLAAPEPASAVSAQEFLEAIIPRTGQAQEARPKRKRMHGESRPAPAATTKPPVPTPKPPADAGTQPAPQTPPTPVPDPMPAPGDDATAQPTTAPGAMPLPEPSPAAEPSPVPSSAGPAADAAQPAPEALPPDADGLVDGAVVTPAAPFAEPLPPAGTVIRPADALGAVIPPVLPPEPPAEAAIPSEPPPEAEGPEPARPPQVAAELAACRAGMATLSITAEPQPPVVEGACGAPDPFRVTAFQSGAVSLAPAATVDCAVASALARWLAEDVQTAARAAFGAPVTAVAVAGSYACRGRDNIEGAKLSEHAFMNAIDIAGFAVAGRTVTVAEAPGQPDADARFIKAIRASACLRFTTVLGPGSDPYHADHLHLDMIKRGRNGDAHFCQ